MLSGRYPSDEFAELRPRITWDRVANKLTPRQGARRVAIINGGTIPDRGLYGVFLAGATKGARVGELDEEMVFESRTGDTIVLGASTWRIEEISHDRVMVSPAPGEPGKMPFWHGDGRGRPAEFGEKIGAMTPRAAAAAAARGVCQISRRTQPGRETPPKICCDYLEDQVAATQRVPSDEDVLIEVCRDELGDRRVCVSDSVWQLAFTRPGAWLSPPSCVPNAGGKSSPCGPTMASSCGCRIAKKPIDTKILLLSPAELKELVLRQLGSTSLFAAKFREAAARALLLPKRRAGHARATYGSNANAPPICWRWRPDSFVSDSA